MQDEYRNMNEIEKIYEELGDFGRYQKYVFFLSCVAAFFSSISVVEDPFTESVRLVRCYIPGCDSATTSYNEPFLNFTTPYNNETQEFDECSYYAAKTEGNASECFPFHFDNLTRVNCTNWKYGKGLFYSTIVSDFDLVCDSSWLAPLDGSSYLAGMVIGSFLYGAIADTFGRKIGILFVTVLFSVSGILSAVSVNYIMFLVFRFLTGMAGVGMFAMPFLIAVESVAVKWRTFCGIMIAVPFALGEASVGVMAYFIRDWRWLQVASTAPSLVLLSYIWLMPESFRWLASKGRITEAVAVVKKAARVNKVVDPPHLYLLERQALGQTEDQMLNKKLPNEEKKGSMLDILKYPNMRKRTLIQFFVWGASTAAYYGMSFNSGNLAGNVIINFILTMLVEIPSYLLSYFLLDRIGRKGSICFFLLLGGVASFISALLPESMSVAIVSSSLIGKFGVSATFGSIYVYTAELYPTEYRGIGLGSCSTIAHSVAILAPIADGLARIYKPLPLLLFGSLSLVAGVLVIFLPETMNHPLHQTLEESEHFASDQSACYFSCCPQRKKASTLEEPTEKEE